MKWRDAKQVLPKADTLVMIYSPEFAMRDARMAMVFNPSIKKPHGVYQGHYNSRVSEWRLEGSPNAWNISHWQPIPNGPK